MMSKGVVSACPKVYIIILHLKNILCLADCISSLSKIRYTNFDIFVVHNGPKTSFLRDALRPYSPHIKEIIDTGSNAGFAAGNNIGIREALKFQANYILLLNDDTVVAPDFLDALLETAEMTPDAGIVGPKIYYFDESRKVWFAGAHFDYETCILTTPGSDRMDDGSISEPTESDYITGCALLIKRQVVERIGLLDERFFLYWEDVDWGLRAKKAGFENIIVPQSRIWHKVSASSGGMDSASRIYHKTRSHLLFARLHAPKTLKSLHSGFFRDIVWLLVKSKDKARIARARAYMAAMIDYHRDRTDRGPHWLWSD
ncbi:MAG TPA: glycosyltransferase family 2 protein [Syntrophales bacterium]|nr:glycosyltransferase family 2 protein [Syntrophales bacterium]